MLQEHKKEIQRWVKNPNEPMIWIKDKKDTFNNWFKLPFIECVWLNSYIYIVDDEQAELRKLQIDKPNTIFEYWDTTLNKWVALKNPYWIVDTKYRVKKEYIYPIFKAAYKGTNKEYIVKFTNLTVGKVVFVMPNTYYEIGNKSTNWNKHTNIKVWQDVLYDKERKLYDKQPILCWNNCDLTIKKLKFYDAKNETTFDANGTRKGRSYDNYIPYPHPEDNFIIEMYKNLKD